MTTTNKAAIAIEVPQKFTTVWTSQRPFQIWYGGRGSAKSWTKAIYFLAKCLSTPYFRGIYARDTQKNVRNSQYQLFQDVANRFDCFRGQFDFTDGPMKITCRSNGNMLLGGSFEQPDTLRSVADPTDFWAEEPITRGSQINRQDFFDIVGSLRNSHGVQTQFHLTFNPIAKTAWIYKDFFEQDLYDAEKLFVNYWDNPFCPDTLITFLRSLKQLDPKRYEVDALGNWGIAYEGLIYDYLACPDDEMPKAQMYGLDFGYNDPCCLMEEAIIDDPEQEKKSLYWNELLYETKHTSASLIKRFADLGVKKNLPMICDNSRPEMIEDLQRAGYNAIACEKYKGSVRDGINEVQKYVLKITRSSTHTLDEVATYTWQERNDKLTEEPVDGFDHSMDAGRYGLEAKKNSVSISDRERQIFAAMQ